MSIGINNGLRIGLNTPKSVNLTTPQSLGASFFIVPSPTYCASDAGHTTPCNNGDSITSWFEIMTQTWVNWVSFASTVKPVFNVSSGKYNASFTNGTFQFPNALPKSDVTIVMRFTPQPFVGEIIGSADSGNVPYNFYRSTTTGPVQRISTGPSVALTNGSDTILSYYGTGTGAGSVEKMRVNGGAWTTVNNARPSTATIVTTLDLAFGAAGGTQFTNFKGMCIFNTGRNDADILACENYFASL